MEGVPCVGGIRIDCCRHFSVLVDGTAYFDNHARLAEIITLLEKQGVLEPGEITISR